VLVDVDEGEIAIHRQTGETSSAEMLTTA